MLSASQTQQEIKAELDKNQKLELAANELAKNQYKEVCKPLGSCNYMQYGVCSGYLFHVGPKWGDCTIDSDAIAKAILEKGKGKNVLDLGAGYGSVPKHWKEKFGLNAIGIVPEGSIKDRPDYLVEGDVQRLKEIPELKGMKFSCIMSAFTLMHLPNPKKVIEDAYELLEDDGLLIFDTTCFSGLSPQQCDMLANDLLKKGYDIITGYPGPSMLHGRPIQCFMMRKVASLPELKLPIKMDRIEEVPLGGRKSSRVYYNLDVDPRLSLSNNTATVMHIENIRRLEKWGIEVPEKALKFVNQFDLDRQAKTVAVSTSLDLATELKSYQLKDLASPLYFYQEKDLANAPQISQVKDISHMLAAALSKSGHDTLPREIRDGLHSSPASTTKPKFEFVSSTPIELQKIIKIGGLKDFLEQGYTTLDQLTQFYHKTPWVLDAMRYNNFVDAINSEVLTVSQIGGLSESQILSLRWKEFGVELKSKVEAFLILNQQEQQVVDKRIQSYIAPPSTTLQFLRTQATSFQTRMDDGLGKQVRLA